MLSCLDFFLSITGSWGGICISQRSLWLLNRESLVAEQVERGWSVGKLGEVQERDNSERAWSWGSASGKKWSDPVCILDTELADWLAMEVWAVKNQGWHLSFWPERLGTRQYHYLAWEILRKQQIILGGVRRKDDIFWHGKMLYLKANDLLLELLLPTGLLTIKVVTFPPRFQVRTRATWTLS